MDDGVKTLTSLMDYTTARQKVLSSNIANSDTPGYTAKEIDFNAFFDKARLKMVATSPMHYKTGTQPGHEGAVIDEDTLFWGDKNNVELDMEISKMTENGLLYQGATKLISTKYRLYKSAAKTAAQ
ncbi:MAG: flagellar basal body rod protein FlgB [Nitrospirae bacterium]|nr:flagellar basal body rod protein FlgB [Nitrospirota bacterium]MBF0534919.1 flagellar basal body rod protein FlgB [Nitrospirota bacterium]MBF0617230.1 flagellar basal body rod protein FlgB [Nitrospirota bacterium]